MLFFYAIILFMPDSKKEKKETKKTPQINNQINNELNTQSLNQFNSILKDLIIFPSNSHEQTFKHCLSKTQTIGKTWRDEQTIILALRPKEFTKFRYYLNQTALEHCNFTQKLVKFVEDDITKYFQFVHFNY